MLQVRKSSQRGQADHGWLKSRHTFSFADYYDAKFMGYRSLRVINEDRIAGGTGFGSHSHRDMEIISYVISGALEHKDSMGTKAIIHPGEVQRMSAGTGVTHSEYNQSKEQETHFLQIWIEPRARGNKPGYGQKSFIQALGAHNCVLVVSPDGRDGSIAIAQDVDLYLSRPKAEETLNFTLRPGRGAWLQMIQGKIIAAGQEVQAGDGMAIEGIANIEVKALEQSEYLLFDLT